MDANIVSRYIDVLSKQRDDALNKLALTTAQLAAAMAEIEELKAKPKRGRKRGD